MKKRYIVLIVILIIFVIAFFSVKKMVSNSEANLNHLMTEQIVNVDLEKVPNGVYTGTYASSPIEVSVRVTVQDHVLTSIEITKHENGRGKPAEAITDKIIKAQSLEVDVISGATYSSKVILKAIENALNNYSVPI